MCAGPYAEVLAKALSAVTAPCAEKAHEFARLHGFGHQHHASGRRAATPKPIAGASGSSKSIVSVSTSGAVSGAATFTAVSVADPDAELLLQVAQGDESAFKILVQKHQDGVTNLAYRLILDRAAAEELAQDVFLRVFRAASRYRPTARFSTWLYRIATNVILNELKSAKRSRTVALDDPKQAHVLKEAVRAQAPGPEDQLQRKEMAASVELALESLPARQRTAVVLHQFEGLSYRDIAEAMNCTVEAVEALLGRAKRALRDALKEYR